MKKIIVIWVILAFSIKGFSQIGVTTVPVPKKSFVFDSTKNYQGNDNISSYIGQILYSIPSKINKYRGKYGFKKIEFANDPKASSFSSGYDISYDVMADKYFIVDTVIIREGTYNTLNILLLSEKDNDANKCCYCLETSFSGSENDFPFISIAYFNYIKNKYVGNQYVIYDYYLNDKDLETGEDMKLIDHVNTWQVVDLTMIETVLSNPPLALIIKSGKTKTYIEHFWFGDEKSYKVLYEKKEWDSMVSKYGIKMMKAAIQRKPMVGMPEKLLILSSGEPQDKTILSNGEKRYYYSNEQITIRGGKVVSWKNTQ